MKPSSNRSKLDDVREALAEIGINGMTVSEVKGFGRQKGHTELYPRRRVHGRFPAQGEGGAGGAGRGSDACLEAIQNTARTGKIGDGKIFVCEVERVIRIRTGEENEDAI